MLALPLCRICVGDFRINFGGFSWRIFLGTFPYKMWKKIRRQTPPKKSGGSNMKINEKSVLPKTDPNTWGGARNDSIAAIARCGATTGKGGFLIAFAVTRLPLRRCGWVVIQGMLRKLCPPHGKSSSGKPNQLAAR